MPWTIKSESNIERVWVELDGNGAEVPMSARVEYLVVPTSDDVPDALAPMSVPHTPVPHMLPPTLPPRVTWEHVVAGAVGGALVGLFQLAAHLL